MTEECRYIVMDEYEGVISIALKGRVYRMTTEEATQVADDLMQLVSQAKDG